MDGRESGCVGETYRTHHFNRLEGQATSDLSFPNFVRPISTDPDSESETPTPSCSPPGISDLGVEGLVPDLEHRATHRTDLVYGTGCLNGSYTGHSKCLIQCGNEVLL